VHAGVPDPVQGEPLLPGPVLASAFHLAGPVDSARYGYQRDGNPTFERYEAALGELEGGEAVLFASGMAAVAAVLLPALAPGDVLVAPVDCYAGVRRIATEHLAPRGVEVRLVPSDEAALREALPGATLVWLETPSNPGLSVLPIRALADAAHAAGARLAVDGTLATPLAQQALELGADWSMSSGSKALTGHTDLVMGHVAVRDEARAAELRGWRSMTGAIPGPVEAWLAHRSLATLDVRLARQCANAQALAELLAARDDVRDVRYPGLPSHPGHVLAREQMRGRFGAVLSFDLGSEARAQAFLSACDLVIEATSFGGVHTTAERRVRWGTDAVGEGFIRFSAGIEDAQDLLADVTRALDATRP
jgi:cystathionine gamma-lyase